MNHVIIQNINQFLVTLRKRFRFNILIKYNQQKCYNLTLKAGFLVINDWKITKQHQRSWKSKLNITIVVVVYVVSLVAEAIFNNFNIIDISSTVSTAAKNSIFYIEININYSIIFIDLVLKHMLLNNVIVYNKSKIVVKITKIIEIFSIIWNDQKTTVNIFKN